jgi:hypothetical protein
MAETDLSGFNGDVTLPSGHGGEAFAWTLNSTMNKKDVSRYGGNRFAQKRGGIIEITGTISVRMRMGAANTAPGLTAPAADGSLLTLTAETGCTYSGTALFDGSINHSFTDPAIDMTYNFEFTGTVTETWATA